MSEEKFCPYCDDPCPPGKDFCCEAHELLFYDENENYDDDFDLDEEEQKMIETLIREENRSKSF